MSFAIETEGLIKIFRSRWSGKEVRAVDGISLRVEPGATFGRHPGISEPLDIPKVLVRIDPHEFMIRGRRRGSDFRELRFWIACQRMAD